MKKLLTILFISNILYIGVLFGTVISFNMNRSFTNFIIESVIGNIILFALAIASFILWILSIYHWNKFTNKNCLEIILLILFNSLYTPFYYLKNMKNQSYSKNTTHKPKT